jgi:hypothetical protein
MLKSKAINLLINFSSGLKAFDPRLIVHTFRISEEFLVASLVHTAQYIPSGTTKIVNKLYPGQCPHLKLIQLTLIF